MGVGEGGLGLLADGGFEVAKFVVEFLVFLQVGYGVPGELEAGEEGDDVGRGELDGLGCLHGPNIPYSSATFHTTHSFESSISSPL